ncbi:MAG: hypothetical protein PHQ43_00135 [Dehalococcoidales bacterium]|nr:hypothetical protein [Dehalococcoidales bacterium]
MFEAYRVRKPFQWRGWSYAPKGQEPAGSPETFAGDIWIVEAGNPRKEAMLMQKFASGDASIPSIDELLKDEKYLRLTEEPGRVKLNRRPERRKAVAVG